LICCTIRDLDHAIQLSRCETRPGGRAPGPEPWKPDTVTSARGAAWRKPDRHWHLGSREQARSGRHRPRRTGAMSP